jgi:hypothetical protein
MLRFQSIATQTLSQNGASVFLSRQDTFIGPMIRSDATENSDTPELKGSAV